MKLPSLTSKWKAELSGPQTGGLTVELRAHLFLPVSIH